MQEVKLDKDQSNLAKSLFLAWGDFFQLSNNDIVLQPNLLADVLKCIW